MLKPNYVPIEGQPDLVRDLKTKAILQTNVNAKKAFQKQRAERQRIKGALLEIDSLKQDIKEIKELLKAFLIRS